MVSGDTGVVVGGYYHWSSGGAGIFLRKGVCVGQSGRALLGTTGVHYGVNNNILLQLFL
jgi:hypothetical protein